MLINDAHEFHLSKSIINYNSEEKSIQITMNMFIDDLELALKANGVDSLNLCTKKEKSSAEDYVYGYILNNLDIEVDGRKITPEFIGKEQSDDLTAVWCYLEVTDIESYTSINITNTIMVDIYDDQKNMTTIQKDKERLEDILFTPKKTNSKIELND